MIYYFSGTGNSLWTARVLGEQLKEPVESLVPYRERPLVCRDPVVGFICPLYTWDLPYIVKTVLERATLDKESYVFLVMTSNNGDKNLIGGTSPAYKAMSKLVEKAGGTLAAAFMLQMPGNALESSPAENEERLAAAPDRVKAIAEAVLGRVRNYTPKPEGWLDKLRGGKDNTPKQPSMGRFTIEETCNGCGVCAKVCPMENIRVEEGRAVHGADCTACFACMHWCPKHATTPGLAFLKKRSQYTHPEVTAGDMAAAKEPAGR